MTDWWLDEGAHAGAEHLDPAYVAGYERKAGYDPTEDLDALRRFGFGGESTVVDLGAGTGAFAMAAARVCRRVVAVDVSPAMTAVLRRKATEAELANVTIVEAGFLSYEHSGEPPDFVFTRNALHQLPDFWKAIALARIAAMLAPGGILRLHDLVFDFEPADAEERIETWFGGAVSDPAAGFTAAELATHTREEFSTYTWLLEPMLEHTGFEILERASRRGAYAAYTCIRRSFGEDGQGVAGNPE
jgi:ubiquinone/menaquinone biosynthesis C-methylase UbiE